jgi:hypothetical protein
MTLTLDSRKFNPRKQVGADGSGPGSIIPIENCGYQPLKLLRF